MDWYFPVKERDGCIPRETWRLLMAVPLTKVKKRKYGVGLDGMNSALGIFAVSVVDLELR